jgi:hypothetical protein
MDVRKRAAIGALIVLTVLMIGMGDLVYSREMDGWSVAWFASVVLISGIVTIVAANTILRAFRQHELRATFDQFYWIMFFILPTSVALFGWAIWIITLYFRA